MLSIVNNLEVVYGLCKCYVVLYKGLEHLPFWYPQWDFLDSNPNRSKGCQSKFVLSLILSEGWEYALLCHGRPRVDRSLEGDSTALLSTSLN